MGPYSIGFGGGFPYMGHAPVCAEASAHTANP